MVEILRDNLKFYISQELIKGNIKMPLKARLTKQDEILFSKLPLYTKIFWGGINTINPWKLYGIVRGVYGTVTGEG